MTPTTSTEKKVRRKFQVCNGYLLDFGQLARMLHFLLENWDAMRVSRKDIHEDTGLTDRQLESLVSIGSAMGLIRPGVQTLSAIGFLIAENDIYIEKRGSLEWCHFVGAGSYKNLIWFEIFNHLLPKNGSMSQNSLTESLRKELMDNYSERTIKKSLREEVHFVIDAYLEQNLSKLGLFHQTSDNRLYIRRYTNLTPLVFCAMLYDFGAANDSQLLQVGEMVISPGSPALLFGLDVTTFRQQIEGLHESGWLRYETAHSLDQIRLKPSFSALEFLTAHFEDRAPHEAPAASIGEASP